MTCFLCCTCRLWISILCLCKAVPCFTCFCYRQFHFQLRTLRSMSWWTEAWLQSDPYPQILCCSVRRSNCGEVLGSTFLLCLSGAIGSISMWPWGVTFSIGPLDYELHWAEDQAIGSCCVNFPVFSSLFIFLKSKCSHRKRANDAQNGIAQAFFIQISSLCTRNNCQSYDVKRALGCEDGSGTASAGKHFCFFYSMSPQCELEFGSHFSFHFLFDELTSEDSSYNMLLLLSTTAWTLAYPSNAGAAFCIIGAVCAYSCEAKHFEYLKTATFGHLDPMEWGIALHIITVVFIGVKASGVPLVTLVEFTQLVRHLRGQHAKRWRVIKSRANLVFITSSYHREMNNQ